MMWALLASVALGHSLAPVHVQLHKQGAEWALAVERPRSGAGVEVRLVDCRRVEAGRYRCSGTPRLELQGLEQSGSPALVELRRSGRVERHLVAEDGPWDAPRARSPLLAHGRLGAEHVLGGLDHVLMVLGLTVLGLGARRPLSRVLLLLSGFTLGHALTLALVALGLMAPPSRWVEAGISLSLVALALAMLRQEPPRLLWTVAVGLLHGLGFGGALAALGLPLGERAVGLAGFNLGVELAQIGLAGLAVLSVRLLAGPLEPRPEGPVPRLRVGLAQGIGLLGVFLLGRALFAGSP